MKLLVKLIGAILANAAAILVAVYFVPEFHIAYSIRIILGVALVLTILNLLVKPVLKLLLAPFIILTFGFGLIAVNAIVLYILDRLSENLTIQGIPALLYATVIISIVNFFLHFLLKNK